MKIILVLMSALLLTACGPEQKPVDTLPPAPVVPPEPIIVEKPKPAEPVFQMSNIMGLHKRFCRKNIGRAVFKTG